MSRPLLVGLQGLMIVGGVAVTVAGLFDLRVADWPIYVAFVALSLAFYPFNVEVLPKLSLPMPTLALTFGFLYIGGLPIVFLRNLAPAFFVQLLEWVLPHAWYARLMRRLPSRHELVHVVRGLSPHDRVTIAADWSMFACGLGVRWAIVSALTAHERPVDHLGAIAVAEVGGYAFWAVLSHFPILSFDPVLPASAHRGHRLLMQDLARIMFALVPFVFLIAYGYRAHGLVGATVWALAALGLHFVLEGLNERRLALEEQNARLAVLNRELAHRERLSAIGRMSSVISHQTLQQLGVIGLHADLIRHAGENGEGDAALIQATRNAEAIQDALGDVNRVLQDLLVFSRDLRLNVYEHRLDVLLAESVEDGHAFASSHGIVVEQVRPGELLLTCDKLKLKQVVANLLRNAIEASPPGGVVTVAATATATDVEITVADRGSGVRRENHERVFTPFFSTKEQGTGLGLAIAQEFAVAHGGRIRVEDREGGGSVFVVRMPRGGLSGAPD